ncbi:MAG TPA: thiamine pyrophosphate-binding protein [Thermoanaerobaculia bacterium]|jgi:2-succinyl-5-enolpyruvyl-6-hydroxy-3-cyclohexene-1-carboxylate synthase|nr:thiamine pyrophosphate-binding protein [Thermoanaerobaculia bacterium]
MTNIAEARRVIKRACALGATDFCVCAGSRNAPLLAVLGAYGAGTDKSVCATSSGTDKCVCATSSGTDKCVCATSSGTDKGVCATSSGTDKGVGATSSGTDKGAGATSSGTDTGVGAMKSGTDKGVGAKSGVECGTDTPVCAGDLRIYSFVDERSAAFFALGRAKLSGRPVAVVTTSGTAVAELLPAAVEAHYSGTKLIFITADRPARYRGTGAPQAIEQEGIFGVYGRGSVVHINIEFDEPLIDAVAGSRGFGVSEGEVTGLLSCEVGESPTQQPSSSATQQPTFTRPLLILSGLASAHREKVRNFAARLNAPIYAEPLSGLREDPTLAHLLITSGERMIGRGGFDGVIRIGNVPTLRFWRDLDESRRDLPLISFSDLPFTGCSRGEVHPLEALPVAVAPRARDERFFANDRDHADAIACILDDEPQSELAMVRALSRSIPANARVYLGNSLPIREWDLAGTREPRGFTIAANRGANGIDGQLSTFFGQCDPSRPNVCVVGDLTAIYDSNAPWIVPQLDSGIDWRIVIINNGGGRIFSRVASLQRLDTATRERMIENVHGIRFDHWAAMWGIEERVTELRPDAEASARAWKRYDALW